MKQCRWVGVPVYAFKWCISNLLVMFVLLNWRNGHERQSASEICMDFALACKRKSDDRVQNEGRNYKMREGETVINEKLMPSPICVGWLRYKPHFMLYRQCTKCITLLIRPVYSFPYMYETKAKPKELIEILCVVFFMPFYWLWQFIFSSFLLMLFSRSVTLFLCGSLFVLVASMKILGTSRIKCTYKNAEAENQLMAELKANET